MLINDWLISFVVYARWILLGTCVNHTTMHADLRSGVRLLLMERVLLSLIPLIVALFALCLLDDVFVPELNEHHMNGIVYCITVRTFAA